MFSVWREEKPPAWTVLYMTLSDYVKLSYFFTKSFKSLHIKLLQPLTKEAFYPQSGLGFYLYTVYMAKESKTHKKEIKKPKKAK